MTFKPEKCYVMSITNKIHISKFQYCLKGVPLQPVSSWPYLGVEIDNKLTWTPHLDKVSKAAARTLGVVQRTLHAAPQAKLEYASTAGSPQTPGKIRKLESIQNKAACFVTHKYDCTKSVTGLKMSLNWPTLESRRNYRDCLMWYKIHHGLIHISFPDSVSQKQRLGRYDHQLAYRQICPREEAYRHSFYVHTIPLWNGLPASICSNCHNPPSLPETGHVQFVWPGHTIDTPNYVLFLTCTLHLCFYLLYVF